MFASEQSHRGIAPMKHSNKDGTLSAESAEGRLRLKENARLLTRTGLRAGLRVSYGWASVRSGCKWLPFIQEKNRMRLTSTRPDLCAGIGGVSLPRSPIDQDAG